MDCDFKNYSTSMWIVMHKNVAVKTDEKKRWDSSKQPGSFHDFFNITSEYYIMQKING